MVKFGVFIPYSEIEEARKKGKQNRLAQERIREEAAKLGLDVTGNLLEKVSIVVWSPQINGMRYEVTHPPEKPSSDGKKTKLRKKRRENTD